MGPTKVETISLDTPLGEMFGDLDEQGAVVGLEFRKRASSATIGAASFSPAAARLAREIAEYFLGTRREFEVPLAPRGTPFQQAVWRELVKIPFGERVAYSDIARRVGRRDAVRAVGAANGANPIAIVIPCHRVVGRDGSLTGYGAGLPIKRWLLDHEAGLRRLPLPPSPKSFSPTAAR